jgi:hypothetical protein
VFGSPDVTRCVGTTVHGPSTVEKSGHCQLHEINEGFEVFSETNEEILVHQVEFGLFQGPSIARWIPTTTKMPTKPWNLKKGKTIFMLKNNQKKLRQMFT